MADNVTVLYIAGIGRTGSTLLARILGSFPGVVNLGEFAGYLTDRDLNARDLPCGCGRSVGDCEWWGTWSSRGLLDVPDVDRVVANRSVFSVSRRTRAAVRRVGQALEEQYRRVAELSGANILVDASKRPSLAMALARAGSIDLRVVHLTRSPKAVVASRLEAKSYLRRLPAWRTSLRWTAINLAADRVRQRTPIQTVLRYEDFSASPQQEIHRLLVALSLPVELNRLVGREITPSVQHSLAGNPDKMSTASVVIAPAPPMQLGRLDATVTSILTAPSRARYGYK